MFMSKESKQFYSEIYEALGEALCSWSKVESTLGQIYCKSINIENGWPAIHGFWAVASFEGKLKMSEAVISSALVGHPEIADKWTSASKQLRVKSKVRNKLAHGVVYTQNWTTRKGRDREDTFFSPYGFKELATNFASLKEMTSPRYDPRPKDRLYAKNIRQISREFRSLEGDLWEISNQLTSAKLPRPRRGKR